MHHQHLALGARMMPAGLWYRPAYYGAPDGRASGRSRAEVRAVREGVGMIDVATLGGLEVRGPDAAELLERIYTFAYAKQPVGRARYVLMTDKTGAIIDDGVACRLHRALVLRHGDDLRRRRASIARCCAGTPSGGSTSTSPTSPPPMPAINVAGPTRAAGARSGSTATSTSRRRPSPIWPARSGHLAGVPVRLLRVGFVGELGYEIHCPAELRRSAVGPR